MEQSRNRVDVNDVNGGSNREPSSGRGAHDQQVNLDRHEATAGKHKIRSRVKPVKIVECQSVISMWKVRKYRKGNG